MKITTGKIQGGAIRAVIYGTEGIGKSTLASELPNPIMLDIEDGTKQLDCARASCLDWRALEQAVKELTTTDHGYQTVVIDTADWLEKRLIEHVLKQSGKKSIEDFGFGKGYTVIQEHVVRFLASTDALIAAGIHVVFVAHTKVVRVSPPDQTDGFDRYELKLTKQVAPLLKEWCDLLLFTNYKLQIVEGSDGRLKAQGGKIRTMYAERCAAWDAKNRFGLPEEMPMKFSEIAHLFGAPAPVKAPAVVAPVIAQVFSPSVTTWLETHAARINSYLVEIKWLSAGQTFADLDATRAARITSAPAKFASAAGLKWDAA